MTRRLLLLAAVAGTAALTGAALLATTADPGHRPAGGAVPGSVVRAAPDVDPGARALLERAAAAPARTAYSGTQYVSAWSSYGATARLLEVTHDPAAGTTWRAVSARPGGGARLHSSATAVPSLLTAGAVDLMARHYSLARAGSAVVAGRPVEVVVARHPRDDGQGPVTARLWLDRGSGLVLRREVYEPGGRPSAASAFVDVAVDARPAGSAPVTVDAAWPHALDSAAVGRLRHRGWTCPESLPGPLPLVDARRDAATLHLSYADGIASVSVFEQRGRLDADRLDGYRRATVGGREVWAGPDLPWRLVWSDAGTVYTLVSDAPQRTVERAVAALSATEDGGGRLDRLGRGLDRVASWFNPMD